MSEVYSEKCFNTWENDDTEGLEFFKRNGGQTITLSEAESSRWQNALQPVIANYRKDMISKGYGGDEIDLHINFIKERIEYWEKMEKERKVR